MSHLVAESALAALLSAGADEAVAIAEETGHVDLRWATNTLTTNGSTRGRRITVIAIVGEGFAVRSATGGSAGDLEALCSAAVTAARGARPAEDSAPLVDGGVGSGWTDGPVIPGPAVLRGFAAALAEVLDEVRGSGARIFGFARHECTTTWLATSAGTRQRHVQPEGCVEWNVKGSGPGQSVWTGQATRDFTDVDVPGTWAWLQQRLAWTEHQVALPAGRYEVILPPTAVADLMIDAYWAAAGRDAGEGRTVFSRAGGGTRIGEHLGPPGLTMRSDPAAPDLQVEPFVTAAGSSSQSSIFDNGLPIPATSWIADGVLTHLLQTRSTAARAGAPATPYVHNLIVEQAGATATLEDMVASTKRGLLLTSLWYIRVVDPETQLLTGLTRDGVFLIEDGQVVGAVNNFRFNESPIDLLGRASEIGMTSRTLAREWSDYFAWAAMPAMRIPDFRMSSVSPAS
jgi:predicted Zn-dependent protease